MKPNNPVLPGLFVVEVEQLPAYEEKNHSRVDNRVGSPSTGSTASTNEVIRSCQREGREHGEANRKSLLVRMMGCYLAHPHYGWTDQELADHLGVERCVVNARRAELPQVEVVGKRKNIRTGINNAAWGLRDTSHGGNECE